MTQLLLNIVVFVSGAVLMALEIVGSRVLAPYFGSSIFVWGSLISAVMTALSIGYYWGGWLSAREPSYGQLLTLLLIPGVLIFFLPFVYPSVNEWIASVDFGHRLNPLIACSAMPIWIAANPMPGALYIVSNMSSTSLRILASICFTGSDFSRRRLSGSLIISRTAMAGDVSGA